MEAEKRNMYEVWQVRYINAKRTNNLYALTALASLLNMSEQQMIDIILSHAGLAQVYISRKTPGKRTIYSFFKTPLDAENCRRQLSNLIEEKHPGILNLLCKPYENETEINPLAIKIFAKMGFSEEQMRTLNLPAHSLTITKLLVDIKELTAKPDRLEIYGDPDFISYLKLVNPDTYNWDEK